MTLEIAPKSMIWKLNLVVMFIKYRKLVKIQRPNPSLRMMSSSILKGIEPLYSARCTPCVAGNQTRFGLNIA